MIAVKKRIAQVQQEIVEWKKDNEEFADNGEELLPETYFKLRFPDDAKAQADAARVLVTQANLE